MPKIISFILIFIPLQFSTIESQDMEKKIEGLFYLDGQPVSITIVDGKIDDIDRIEKFEKPESKNYFIGPGLIDNQLNGYLSHQFSNDNLMAEDVIKVTKALYEFGITTYLPTLTTSSHETLFHSFKTLAEAMENETVDKSVPGFHLEGPYISPIDGFRGAHDKRYVREPDWREFEKYYEVSGRKILEVTLAPELEGAIDFIKKLRSLDIIVALGHHNGSKEIITEAVDAGASISTHLGNACASMINRHVNPLWPQLAEDRLMASLIVDGFHLRQEEVKTFYSAKGHERIILVSDLSSIAGMPPGIYDLYGEKVQLHENRMISVPSQNVLAGASFMITCGIVNLMKFTGCSLADAVNTASKNPAELLDLKDRGEIEVGKRADLILFKIGDKEIDIYETYLAGELVYGK